MASNVQKITLSGSRDIPFNKLVLSQSNVRRIKAGVSVEELAEDIARRTLLQSLNVRPVLDAEGAETGVFEIPAGGRRYQALALLVKQKRLAKTALIPCVVRNPATSILAEDDSLAENLQRVALHPLDQFRAFQTLRQKGQSDEDIAAAFFVSVNVVKQRLRLAAVSEKLLAIYAEDGMTLEQLTAFTVTSDHARQEQVWEAIQKSWSKEAYQIRRMLTERAVQASDRRAVFVGVEAYEAAGGAVTRDLFAEDEGGWLETIGLLDRLVADKLKAEAETVAAEGWRWVEAAVDFPYGHDNHLRRLDGTPESLTAEEQATLDALNAEHEKLEAEYADADELPDEVDKRMGEIETALVKFEDRPVRFERADIARAGAFVGIDEDGGLFVDRGYVRPEDEAASGDPEDGAQDQVDVDTDGADPSTPAPHCASRVAVITVGGEALLEEDEDGAIAPLPERLLLELTAHRTLALRDAVANNPHVAMTALLHKLCLDTFSHGGSNGCLEVSVRHVFFPVQAADLKQSTVARAVVERHEAWKTDLPKDSAALWNWLSALTEDRRAVLLAHCVSFGVNALHEKGDRHGGPGISSACVHRRIRAADQLANAVGLDMVAAGWRATAENYLGRVTKPRILEAVREARGEDSVRLIDHLKKADMAKEAERLLEGTGWLPEPLRDAGLDDATIAPSEDSEALPDFLIGDDVDEAAGEEAISENDGAYAREAMAAE